MTTMTVLHIASPFAFSMPLPDRAVPVSPGAATEVVHATTADFGIGAQPVADSDGAAMDGGNERFGPNSREAVVRRYKALGGSGQDDAPTGPRFAAPDDGDGALRETADEAAKIFSQDEAGPGRQIPNPQGSGERGPGVLLRQETP